MIGVLVVDKPQDFTSFDVVAKLRGIFKMKKIGHGGTLDPMATGVLPVFIGGATKAMDILLNQEKAYCAKILLGKRTDTGDITGTVVESSGVSISQDEIKAALPAFIGAQKQLPPLYSAIKVNGKAMYRYAREGKPVERKPRDITIHSLDFLGMSAPETFGLQVGCSKGTYVRSLAEDIATSLGTVGTLAALRRTQAGIFSLEHSHTLAQIQQAKEEGRLQDILLPVQVLFEGYNKIEVSKAAKTRLLNGAAVYGVMVEQGLHAAWCNGEFLGLVQQKENNELHTVKLFCERDLPQKEN